MRFITVFLFLLSLIVVQGCMKPIANKQPAWMQFDSQKKTVKFDLVSGDDGRNNGFNYNGYYAGNVTLKVPDGWNVEVMLTNRDGSAPHNIIVTYPYLKQKIPEYVGSEAAVLRRAYTEDAFVGQQESMRFVAKTGEYWFFCGISGHGINDMWINFEVNPSLISPEVETK